MRSWLAGRGGERVRQRRLSGARRTPRRWLVVEALECRHLLAAVASDSQHSGLAVDPTAQRAAALLVQFKPGVTSTGSLAAYAIGGRFGSGWDVAPGLHEVQLPSDNDVEAARQVYAADPNIAFVEPDYRVKLNWIPNDPAFEEQWDLRNLGQLGGVPRADIHAPEAWDVTTGSPAIVVAVIDTGVDYTHPDLAPNMWVNSGETPDNGLDDDSNGYVDDVHGYDFVNHDGDPMDDYFHGTHVAGTIAAVADNEEGIAGVAPRTRIMALKFLDAEGNGFTSDALSALNYAVANGASISNNSWGGGEFSQAFQTALQSAASQGHIFVAAAGNNSNNNDTRPYYPASYSASNVVSVAATDIGDYLAWFSNYGKKAVDIAAPGVDIYSTVPMQATLGMLNEGLQPGYGRLSGTSMAAPHVSGALALLRAEHPEWTVAQLLYKILSTADAAPSLTSTTVTGGRLNVARALGVIPQDSTPPRIVKADPTGITTKAFDHIRITFSEPIEPASFDLGDIVEFITPEGISVPVIGVTPVPGSNKEFDITFAPYSALGDYRLTLGPHIRDTAGNEIDQDGDGQAGVDGPDYFTSVVTIVSSPVFGSGDVPLAFNDLELHASYLTVDQDLPIGDVDVSLNLTFPRAGRLAIWLVSPAGTTVMLSYRHGGSQANYWDTVFDDSADVPVADGSAPFTGAYRPDELLSILNGENAHGTWTLYFQNMTANKAQGTLNSWSLDIEPGEYSGGGGGEGHINHPPVAANDAITVVQSTPFAFAAANLLANDSDPDGDPLWVINVHNAIGGTVALDAEGLITFTPTVGGLAPGSFQYVVSDGLSTTTASVAVTVIPKYPWHNSILPADVNNDGYVVPLDALLVINLINTRGAGGIIGVGDAASAAVYYDVVADNGLFPNDALVVVNWLNTHPKQSGPASTFSSADSAEGELGAADQPAGIPFAGELATLDAAAIDHCLAVDALDLIQGETTPAARGRRRPG